MSNTIAIAAVTSTLRHLLHESLGGADPGAVSGADVTTLRPRRLTRQHVMEDSRAGLNVYLYEVSPSRAEGFGVPMARRKDENLGHQPLAELDLHYVVTAYGDDATLEPQRLLARAARALAATPVITSPIIAAAIAKYGSGDTAFLANSDLGEQLEPVKLVPAPLSIDEMSKLWRALATPYLLSLGYTATAVLL